MSAPSVAWPVDRLGWVMLFGLFFVGLFSCRRGFVMQTRSMFFDRLGLSSISYDYVFGFVYVTAGLFNLHPASRTPNVRMAILILTIAITAWAWFEMEIASPHRVERVVSSGTGKDIGAPGDPDWPVLPYDGPDRRVIPWGRRHADQRGLE